MQQESGAVISIRRCQSILLFNTSINKSDWCYGLLPQGTLSGRMEKCEGEGKLCQGSPRGQRPARPDPAGPGPAPTPPPPASSGPALGSGTGSSPGSPAPAPAPALRGAGGGRRSRRDSPRRLSGSDTAKLTQPGEIRSIFFAPTGVPETRCGRGGVHRRLEPGLGPPVLVDLYLGFTYLNDTPFTPPPGLRPTPCSSNPGNKHHRFVRLFSSGTGAPSFHFSQLKRGRDGGELLQPDSSPRLSLLLACAPHLQISGEVGGKGISLLLLIFFNGLM